MDFEVTDKTFREWHCPVYGRKIDEALCYEISNIGALPLPEKDRLPCSVADAQRQCSSCQHYAEWD